MKIIIELNEEELKGLIFGQKEPKNQPNARCGYDILYESRYIADCILEDMMSVAREYGYISVAEFKELVNKRIGIYIVVYFLDKKQGWTLDMLQKKAYITRMRNGYGLGLPYPLFIE